MKPSLKGGYLPESAADFESLTQAKGLQYKGCIQCRAPFTTENTHSAPGWRDTQIIGMCEDCYDGLFEESVNG